MPRRLNLLPFTLALLSAAALPASAAEICVPVHHVHHVQRIHHIAHHVHRAPPAARLTRCDDAVVAPETTIPGYNGPGPLPEAYKDITGKNGSPCYRAADQQRSYAMQCGIVYHRFFDEYGSAVNRGVRVCN